MTRYAYYYEVALNYLRGTRSTLHSPTDTNSTFHITVTRIEVSMGMYCVLHTSPSIMYLGPQGGVEYEFQQAGLPEKSILPRLGCLSYYKSLRIIIHIDSKMAYLPTYL